MRRLAIASACKAGRPPCRPLVPRAFSTTGAAARSPPVKKKKKKNNADAARMLFQIKAHSPPSGRARLKPDPPRRGGLVEVSRYEPKIDLQTIAGDRYNGHHRAFWITVLNRLQVVLTNLSPSQLAAAGLDDDGLNERAGHFVDQLEKAFGLAEEKVTARDTNPLFWRLKEAFITRDIKGLTKELQYSFQSLLLGARFSKELEQNQMRLLDLRFPHEWFPATRTMQRTIHLHVGPTNSGKTYNALKALENSKSGVYAGPLRLLATEVYQRLRAKGLPCALITGEEVRMPEDADRYFSSCTVEMIPLNTRFDVAVIDEIQMIGDLDRGNAWTTAVLGVQAKELHLCGEDRTVPLIQALCDSIGDKCVVHRYERLSPLKAMDSAIGGDYSKLRKGDAVVAFSRPSLHVLKRTIEAKTGRRCAIIYGSLPPEVRSQQAALFNDPDNDYDFVVASDAIGMGLNLEIRRVILESVFKYDGSQNRLLTHPEIKQIGGRAGRYRTAASVASKAAGDEGEEKVGYVTTMDKADLRSIHRAFEQKVTNIKTAMIQPPAAIVERLATYFSPDTPLSVLLMRIKATSTVGPLYQLNISNETLEISDIIQDLPLTIYDRLTFCYLPVALRAVGAVDVLRGLARVVAQNSAGDLLSIKEMPLEFLDLRVEDEPGGVQDYLFKLESLHVAINQYVWLSYRYSGMFRSQALAFYVRSLVEEKLIETLERLNFTAEQLESKRLSKRRQVETLKKQRRKAQSRKLGMGEAETGRGAEAEGGGGEGGGQEHQQQQQEEEGEGDAGPLAEAAPLGEATERAGAVQAERSG